MTGPPGSGTILARSLPSIRDRVEAALERWGLALAYAAWRVEEVDVPLNLESAEP